MTKDKRQSVIANRDRVHDQGYKDTESDVSFDHNLLGEMDDSDENSQFKQH